MKSVEEALTEIIAHMPTAEPRSLPLLDCLGLVLAREIVSEADSPPFDKALMDGFALRSADVSGGAARLTCVEEVMAGQVPQRTLNSGEATLIMTGAPVPVGSDAVVRIEDSEYDAERRRVQISTSAVRPGMNLLPQGTSLRRGDRILSPGSLLRPQDIGALAELGHAQVSVYPQPRVAVMATGDELVEVHEQPGPGQIRNSNESMLSAQISAAGALPFRMGIARDNSKDLQEKIQAGLQHDILLLSGGVSAGKLDLVPQALADAQVQQVFHKVHVKPGKPVWFGVCREPRCVVFGLPGTPVGSLVCFELFVKTAIRRVLGRAPFLPRMLQAKLSKEHIARGDRPTYYPARLEWAGSEWVVAPVSWQGSSDLCSTVAANSMVEIPAGGLTLAEGSSVNVMSWNEHVSDIVAVGRDSGMESLT